METKVAILSTAYLPPIQYFSKLLKFNKILIEKYETYPRQTYRNRCEIYSANGKLPLVIPVIKPNGNSTKISEVRIDYSVKWQREHWRALESAYKNSAFFEYIMDEFKKYYESNEWEFLIDFNTSIIKGVLNILDYNLEIGETNEFIKQYPLEENDFRYSIHPKPHRRNHDDEFLIRQYFQVFSDKHGFLPNLSVFDILCNCGKESVELMR